MPIINRILQLQDYFSILLLALLLIASSGCNTYKYLNDGERLLTENKVEFVGENKVQNKSTIAYDLTTLYKQSANTNFLLLFPREKIYFKTEGKTNRIARWRRRVIAEPPAIFSEEKAQATAESMEYYLQNKGYFEADVYPEFDRHERKNIATVTYKVNNGPIYTIDTTNFISRDTSIQQVLIEMKDQSLLKKGTPVAKDIYDNETTRITKYLRNNGYAYFYPNSIAPLQGDSTGNKVDVTLEVLRPASDSIHKQYRVGQVFVFPDYNAATPEENLRDSLIQGVHFYSNQNPYRVRAQVLRNQVYLKEGDLYRQENYDKTNRAFGTLGTYKFVSIKQEIDPDDDTKINFFIYLTRNKQLEFGVDFDVNYTNQQNGIQQSLNLLGFSVSPSIRNRNIFGGAELLVSRAEAGLETALGRRNFINTLDISITNELYFPKFIDYFGLWRTMNKIGGKRKLVGERFYQTLREKATTRVGVEYNFLKRINFFEYNLFNASFGYDIQADPQNRFLINHVGVDLLLPESDTTFLQILEANPFLQRSFGKQLFTGLFFKDFNYIYSGRRDRNGNSWNLSAYAEISGTEIWLANKLYNGFSANIEPDTFQFTRVVDGQRDTTEFAQYAKLQLDLRYNRQFNPKNALAIRFYSGIGTPFGFSDEVPYVKQYFAGGPNSLRGWNVRGVGPGSYIDTEVTDRRFFYQTGDIRLELNMEYRFDIFKFFSATTEGALFIDAGNIWTLNDDGRQGGQFLWKPRTQDGEVVNEAFYQQIAINGGFGLRFDLSYFVFRLDMGYPLRYPSLDPLNGNRGERWQQLLALNRVNYVLGLGYPF